MRKLIVLMAGLSMVAGACSSNSGGTPDAKVNKNIDMGSNMPGRDVGTNFMDTTVKTMRSSLGSSPSSQLWHIPSSTIIVSQSYASGAKWKGYFQDTGMADGLDLYCNSTAKSTPCYSMAVPNGDSADIYGLWDPYMGVDELIPLKAVDKGAGSVTYAASPVPSAMVAEGADSTASAMYGTPIHLSGGPWMVTDLAPAPLKNPSYVAGGCTKGPAYFGFEVTDMSDSSKVYVMTEYYKSINFTNDANCTSTGDVVLTTSNKFTKLGGVVDNVGTPTAPLPGVKPFNMADYTLM